MGACTLPIARHAFRDISKTRYSECIMQRLCVYLVLLAAAAVPFLQVRGQPEPPPPAPPMPPMLKQGLGNAIGNVLSLLTGHGPGDGKVYPFPLECEGELKHQCTSVLRVCHHGEKCNLECMAKNPPNISRPVVRNTLALYRQKNFANMCKIPIHSSIA